MQPLHAQNHATSQQKISRNLSTKKIMQPLHKKTFFTKNSFQQKLYFYTKNLFTQKTCNLFTHKITQPFTQKNRTTCPPKKIIQPPENKSCNLSELVSEKNHPTSLHKITQPLNKINTQPVHQKNYATSPQKNHASSPQKKSHNLSKKIMQRLGKK